jgi:signal transduction histidine kinase
MTSLKNKIEAPGKIDSQDNPASASSDAALTKKQLFVYNDLIMIGKLTPEVVHDINNYLTGILGYAELLSMKKIQDQSIKNGLQNIYISAEKCKDLLAHLIALTRSENSVITPGNLNALVEEAIVLRNCALRHKQIVVFKDLGNDLPAIPIQGNKLEKALLALIFYAEDTLEHKENNNRKITFKTSYQAPGPALLRLEVTASKEVSMDLLATMKSKEYVQGETSLGVGLPEAMAWVQALGGSLEVELMEEEGFSFLIHLPLKS